jgi:hypothetical protein
MADEAALNVIVGGSVSGNIDVSGDVDDIRVFLVAGQTYLVSLRGTGATAVGNSFLQVYDPGAALVNFDDDGGNDTNSLMTFTAAATGNYTIRASSLSAPSDPGTGQWTVDVRVQGVDAVGDTNATAVAMSPGTTFGFRETATVAGGADLDRYEVTLEEGHFYTFNLAAGADYNTTYTAVPAGEVDTILRLRNPAGTLIAQSDDLKFPTDISSGFGFLAQTSGTYYLDVTGYLGQTGGYIVDMQDVDYHNMDPLEAINWDSAANIDTVTVAGTPTAYVYFGTAGETFGEPGLPNTWGWNATEKAAVMSALAEFTKTTGITYLETSDINQAEFRLQTVTGVSYDAYFNPQDPAFGAQQGIGVFNVNSGGWDKLGVSTQDIPGDQVSLDKGGFAYATLLRYFGQAHGLASPHNKDGGSETMLGVVSETNSYGLFNLNQGVYTIMSKNAAWELHPDGPSPFTIAGIGSGWSGTLGAFDIAVLQQRYGVHAYAAGDTVYSLSSVQQSGVYYETIWDTGGIDVIVYDGTGRATIDLTAATLDYSLTGAGVLSFVDQIPGTAGLDGIFGGFTIANGVVIENATGGSGNDVLIGNSANNGIEGRGGNDMLTGRGGNDRFVFATGYDADTVTDFVAGANTDDKIDLRAFTNIQSLADLLAISTQQGANTVIDFGGGDTLTLLNVVRESLHEDDLFKDPAKKNDFNGDGMGDLLWQNLDGTPAIWLMDGTNVLAGANAGFNPGAAWHVVDSGDFNADGKVDILWQHDDGTIAEWLMDGTTLVSGASVAFNPGPSWHAIAAGDFNADSKADVLWQNDSGAVAVWLMDGLNILSGADVGTNPGPAWKVQTAADFNGDGKSDILWQNDNGQAAIWLMDGNTLIAGGDVGPFNPGASWDIEGAGDFNGDGKADILWQNDDGQAGIWLMDGLTFVAGANVGSNPGSSWEIQGASDFDGDGDADIVWQNADGTPAVWLMDGLDLVSGTNAGFNPGQAWNIVPQTQDHLL